MLGQSYRASEHTASPWGNHYSCVFEPSLNYFSGNRSGLNVFILLPLLVLVCIHWALVTDEHRHIKVFSSLRHSRCFHVSNLDKINKNWEGGYGQKPGESKAELNWR